MNRKEHLDRVEAALSAVHRERGIEGESATEERHAGRIMMRVRAAARNRPEGVSGDARFLWRFLSAGAVVAAALVLVAVTDLTQDVTGNSNGNTDDVVVTVLNPTLPF